MITLAHSSAETLAKPLAKPMHVADKVPNNMVISMASLLSGALLGLSAPGFDQWYLAWVGLVPLILLYTSSKNLRQAFMRGLLFGAGYHLVYLNWIFGLHPLDWLKFNQWQSGFIAAGALSAWSFHQALLVGIFAVFCRWIPLTGSLLPQKISNRWHWPALIVVPIIWVLWMSKLGNAHSLLGVPWGMLEYSQYKQFFFLQIASIIGGIGIGFLIAVFNTSLASLIATLSGKTSFKAIAAGSRVGAILQFGFLSLIMLSAFAGSFNAVKEINWPANQAVSILQGNINFNMFRATHNILKESDVPFLSMISQCPPGLCLGSENALPYDLFASPHTCDVISDSAQKRKLDIVLGCLHSAESLKAPKSLCQSISSEKSIRCNSACAIAHDGTFLNNIYHKRYLVPVSEYTPAFFQVIKEWMHLPRQWKVKSLVSGKEPVVFNLSCGAVAPLICVECMSPELACSSVRAGGELLVTLGDPSFLHDSMVGTQMIAINVLRAVENRRYVVFACNTGPSSIIDPSGRIISQSPHGKQQLLVGKVGFNSELTTFCRWFSCLGRL